MRADFTGLNSVGHRNGKFGALMLLVKSQRSSNFGGDFVISTFRVM